MKILHYSLGFPPYRTGGLVKFCMDLIETQIKHDFEVSLMWPGRINNRKKTTIIKKKNSNYNIESIELVNPQPVSLDEGIRKENIKFFIEKKEISDFIDILEDIKPDYIHIHTLMGLPYEFILAAKKLKIKTIFTSHDYFGICPKVNLFYDGDVCKNNSKCEKCTICNQNALSYKKIKLLQSPIYRTIKNLKIIKILRKIHRRKFFSKKDNYNNVGVNYNSEYLQLRNYYINILNEIDVIHFNSNLAKQIYSQYLDLKKFKILNISHRDIKDNRKIREYSDKEILKITYLASSKPYKGYNLLKEALEELWKEQDKKFVLNVYADIKEKEEFINVKGKYCYKDLENIFNNTDILIAPSLWYETFGYTVLEAISYGVPVIISENVGAKDIVGGAGIIIKSNNKNSIKEAIKNILDNRDILKQMNKETFECKLPKLEDMFEILEETNG